MNRRQFLRGAAGFPLLFNGCATRFLANERINVAAIFDAGRTLEWDAKIRRFKDSPAANARIAQLRVKA